jgi:integrase
MTPKKRRAPKAIHALTREQLERVLLHARGDNWRNYLMILLSYWHGLRSEEVRTLRLSNIEKSKDVWYLRVKRVKDSLETVQAILKFKNKSVWDERGALEEYLNKHRRKSSFDFLFPSQMDEREIDHSVYWRKFREYCEACGIPKHLSHVHILKHSLGLHLAQAGENLEKIRQALGHASITSTAVYTRVADSDADAARSRLLEKL